MTRTDAARKIIFFVLWVAAVLVLFPVLTEYDIPVGVFFVGFFALFLGLSVVAFFLAEWFVPRTPEGEATAAQERAAAWWRPYVTAVIWAVAVTLAIAISASWIGLLAVDEMITLFAAIGKFL